MLPICIMELMTTQDFAVINGSLTPMSLRFHVPVTRVHWAISAQLLTIGGLLILAGWTGDRFGKKPVFVAGLCISVLGNVLVSMSPSFALLIGARVVTGIGMALMYPIALSLIADLFTAATDRDRALSAISVAQLVGLPTGALFGGLIMEHFGWQAGFLLNGALAVLTVPLALTLLPGSRAAPMHGRSLDVVGIVLVAATSVLLVWAISSIREHGAGGLVTLAAGALAIGLVAALVVVERSVRNPILPLSVLRLPSFIRACALIALVTCLNTGLIFTLSVHLQHTGARASATTWLLFVPMAIGSFVGSLLIPPLVVRTSRSFMILVGLSIDAMLLIAFAFVDPDSLRYVPIVMGIASVCMLFIFVPAQTQAFADVPDSLRGVSSSLIKMAYNLPTGIGIAIVAGALAAGGNRAALLAAGLFAVVGLVIFALTARTKGAFSVQA
jgi:MFS family permease